MKIAILSDIHGNLPALQAVADDIDRWRPTSPSSPVTSSMAARKIWPAGSLSANGRCRQDWHILRGNHEEYVVEWLARSGPLPTPEFELRRLSYHTYQQLAGHIPALAGLPDRYDWCAPDGSNLARPACLPAGQPCGHLPLDVYGRDCASVSPLVPPSSSPPTRICPFQRRLGRHADTQLRFRGAARQR